MPPPNDDFLNAEELVGDSGSVQGDNTGATSEFDEAGPTFGTQTVWYRWTPVGDGTVTFATGPPDAGTPLGDTSMEVYSGGPTQPDLSIEAHNDDGSSPPWSEIVDLAVSNGVTYYIRVEGFSSSDVGAFTLTWSSALVPPPDPGDPPVIVSATANGARIVLTYDRDLNRSSTPPAGAYAVTVGGLGDTRTPIAIRLTTRTVRLQLGFGVHYGDPALAVYYDPGGDPPVEGRASGDPVAVLFDYPVENLTPAPLQTRSDVFGQFPWRTLVTTLDTEMLSLLDGHARERTVTARLGGPWDATGYVYSASPAAQQLAPDGDPVLAEGSRLLYVFRQEPGAAEVGTTWVCRYAGIIDNVEDVAEGENAVTHYTSRDPWQYLYNRPVTNPVNGFFPGPDGLTYIESPAGAIARDLIGNTVSRNGGVHLDLDSGTHEDGDNITITLQQGSSVGEALDEIVATGKIEIVLEPVYDPVGRPGICAVLHTFVKAGDDKSAGVIFGWGAIPGTMVRIDRTEDGTERANKILYYYGQGGPPVGIRSDADSVDKYGEYWKQQFWPGVKEAGPLQLVAEKDLSLYKDGKTTHTFAPFSGTAPRPFRDWTIGDRVPIYARGTRLRERIGPLEGTTGDVLERLQRVMSFTVSMSDDGTETVSDLFTVTDDVIHRSHFEGPLPGPIAIDDVPVYSGSIGGGIGRGLFWDLS